jgi:RNA 2',3'-cyclic 3'-phosphodiesterase
VAIEIPDAVREAVAGAIAPWRDRFPNARWAPRENWHVTLKFLGRTFPRLAGWVGEQVAASAGDAVPFETELLGLGAFPSATRARVLWAGLDDRAGRMAEIALALDAALSREFTPEARPFRPHVTVARSRPPLGLPPAFAETRVEPVAFKVEHVTLFRSHLRRPAPRYEPLGAFRLGG